MSELSVAEVLNRAADLIEPEGAWYSPHVPGAHDCVCAWTAINAASGIWDHPAGAALAKFIGVESVSSIWTWNDAPERTQAEVVAKLREAARLSTPPRVGEG